MAATIDQIASNETSNNNIANIQDDSKLRNDGELDGRKNNCGSSKRTTYTSKQKWDHIEDFEMWMKDESDNGENATVTTYIKQHRLATKFKKYLPTSHPGWREPDTKHSIQSAVTDKLRRKLAVPARANLYIAKYPLMEHELVNELKEKCTRMARVSSLWLRTTVKKSLKKIIPMQTCVLQMVGSSSFYNNTKLYLEKVQTLQGK